MEDIEKQEIVRCRECIFWKRHTGEITGSCSCQKFILGYHEPDEEIEPDSVLVENDEGWGFYPCETFGCVHGKRR